MSGVERTFEFDGGGTTHVVDVLAIVGVAVLEGVLGQEEICPLLGLSIELRVVDHRGCTVFPPVVVVGVEELLLEGFTWME